MSRGGRGGRGRGGRPKGPEVEWDDEPVIPQTTKPEPLFPVRCMLPSWSLYSHALQAIDLPVPKPPSNDEIESAQAFLSFRDQVRNGPFYTELEPSSFTDEHGKTNPKAGFDPFTGVAKYSSRFAKPRRTVPDFSGHDFRTRHTYRREEYSR